MNNTVFVGKKHPMKYVQACLTQLGNGSDEVVVKARGKSISRAVDATEILRNRFATDLEVEDISTGTDEVETDDGGKINVSTISITVG